MDPQKTTPEPALAAQDERSDFERNHPFGLNEQEDFEQGRWGFGNEEQAR